MNAALYLAWILGPFYLIMGLWLLVNRESVLKLYQVFKKGNNEIMLTYGACINLILGLVVLSFYREWVQSWEVLITITGWLTLIKGVVLLFRPDFLLNLKISKTCVLVSGLVFVVVGVVLVNAVYGLI